MRSLIRSLACVGAMAAVAGVLSLGAIEGAEAKPSVCNSVEVTDFPNGQAPVRQSPGLAPAPISRWGSPGPGTPTAC